jgi:hypothetical protein
MTAFFLNKPAAANDHGALIEKAEDSCASRLELEKARGSFNLLKLLIIAGRPVLRGERQ